MTGSDSGGESKLLFMLEALQNLRREMTEQHQRLRGDMTAGVQGVTHELQTMRDAVNQMALDVNTIRTAREIEDRYSTRRATWAGLFAGFMFSVLMKLGEWLWHR